MVGMDVDSTAAAVQELQADCQELQRMLDRATRPNVRKELQRVLDVIDAERVRATAKVGTPVASSPAGASAPSKAAGEAASKAAAPKAVAKPPEVHKPVPVDIKPNGPWTEITTFALDLGGFDKPVVTVDLRLKGVEALPTEKVTCDFTESSLDVKVIGLDGQNYRFLKTNLEKDIVPAESSVKVKKNHVIITLHKVKGQYGYDHWSDLCAKGRRKPTSENKESNPQDSIMSMMRDLYEDGDDNMKKIIGEAMTKSRTGEKFDPKDADFKPPSLSEMDDI